MYFAKLISQHCFLQQWEKFQLMEASKKNKKQFERSVDKVKMGFRGKKEKKREKRKKKGKHLSYVGLLCESDPVVATGRTAAGNRPRQANYHTSLRPVDCEQTRHYQSLAVPLLRQHAVLSPAFAPYISPPPSHTLPRSAPHLRTSCRSVTWRREPTTLLPAH